MNQQNSALEASPQAKQISHDTIIRTYKNMEINEILSVTDLINVKNCKIFFSAVAEVIRMDVPTKIAQISLFELLKVITSSKECLDCFVDGDFTKSLIFTNEDFLDITLSIYIPIFEHHRESISSDLILRLEALIPLKPLKIARLFAIYTDDIDKGSSTINLQIIDILIMRADIFLKADAAKILIQMLFKFIQSFPHFIESRGQYCLNIFVKGLSSSNDDIVFTSYDALLSLNNIRNISIPNNLLIMHLNDDIKRDYALQFLTKSAPDNVSPELLYEILKKFEISNWAEFAFLNLCHECDFQEGSLQFLNNIIDGSIIDIQQTFKMLILLSQNNNIVNILPNFEKLYTFFADIINEKLNPVFLELIYNIIKHFDINEEIFSLIESSSFLSKYLSMIIRINEENYYFYGYLIIDFLGRFRFSQDFLLMMNPSIEHLNSKTALQCCSLSYFVLISNYQEAMSSIIDYNIFDEIKKAEILSQNKHFAFLAVSNIKRLME